MITAALTNGKEIQEKFAKLSLALQTEALAAVAKAAALPVASLAREKAPGPGNTTSNAGSFGGDESGPSGNLKRSIHASEPIMGTGMAMVIIGTNVIYARIHEFGGTIAAKNAPYLVFRTYDGVWHRTKSVYMPARPYMRPAVDEGRGAAVEAGAVAFAMVVRRAFQ